MKTNKILSAFLMFAIIITSLCLWRSSVAPNEAVGQEKPNYVFATVLSEAQMDSVLTRQQILRTLKIYHEYSVECYGDSGINTSFDNVKLNNMEMFEFDSTNYVHRQPTFPGFMQFLEEKLCNLQSEL